MDFIQDAHVDALDEYDHQSEWSSGLRRQFAVRQVASSNPARYIYFHFEFSLASRSVQLCEAHTNENNHVINPT